MPLQSIHSSISLVTGIAGANDAGTLYEVTFDAGPTVIDSIAKNATLAGDGLLVEILNGSDGVIGSLNHLTGEWTSGSPVQPLSPARFTYTGDGDGPARIRISGTGSNHFNGAIDNLSIGLLTVPRVRITDVSHNSSTAQFSISWESAGGKLYNLRSETDPSAAEPINWPIFGGQADLAATPPENTLTIALPPEAKRFFVIEEFNAPPVSILADDFESGPGLWTTGSPGAAGTDWELGTPSNVGPAAAHSPVNCFGTNLADSYAIDADAWLRSPPIDLTTAGGATLTYFQFYDIEAGFDSGNVSVLDSSDDSVLAVIEADLGGESPDWEQVTTVLPPAALGKIIKIEFRLISDDFDENPFAGWYLDDFNLTVP